MNQKIKVSLFVYEKVQEVEGSRGQGVERSRGQEVKRSRGQGVKGSRGRGVERIKVEGSKIPLRERQKIVILKNRILGGKEKKLPSL